MPCAADIHIVTKKRKSHYKDTFHASSNDQQAARPTMHPGSLQGFEWHASQGMVDNLNYECSLSHIFTCSRHVNVICMSACALAVTAA